MSLLIILPSRRKISSYIVHSGSVEAQAYSSPTWFTNSNYHMKKRFIMSSNDGLKSNRTKVSGNSWKSIHRTSNRNEIQNNFWKVTDFGLNYDNLLQRLILNKSLIVLIDCIKFIFLNILLLEISLKFIKIRKSLYVLHLPKNLDIQFNLNWIFF